jgi:methionyl-tRNA formyltransferase
MKVALFSNTGMGNDVLYSLINNHFVKVKSVFTNKFDGTYPYYEEKELYKLCDENNIACYTNMQINSDEVFEVLKEQDLDLIIVATFNQILKSNIIRLPRKGIINFHPSLLPQYKGPSPVRWVLLNGEKYTGITIHYLIDEIDAGDVILQQKIEISELDDCGSLLKKISMCAGEVTNKVIEKFLSVDKPIGKKQDKKLSTYFGKPKDCDFINLDFSINQIINIIKAFSPFPKAYFSYDNIKYKVTRYHLTNQSDNHQIGIHFSDKNNILTIVKEGRVLTIFFTK